MRKEKKSIKFTDRPVSRPTFQLFDQRMDLRMNMNLHFSVFSDALNELPSSFSDKNPENRYHFSHAVWQLARMGAYNATGEIPLAVRLERNGEIGELYSDHERFIALIDTSETDPADPALIGEILLGFAVRLATSSSPGSIRLHIVCSSKAIESVSQSLKEWKNESDLTTALAEQINELINREVISKKTVATELAAETIGRTTIEYQRRRQGRMGDESLWGRELDGLKVLQDAGLAGNDLGPAIRAIIRTVSSAATAATRKQPIDREAAFLLIRDFQRRARIAISSVRMIDDRFLTEEETSHAILPRCPSWRQARIDRIEGVISRTDLDACIKWARRAAIISGRGLLPIFLFSGSSGNGRSLLLRETALHLYGQGYTIAEILDIDAAGNEAEHLANAAMSGDSPLILVWDDALGLGQDPVAAFREIASAQISGAPIVLLAATPDSGVSLKQIKKIQHSVFEEFTIHGPSAEESNQLHIEPQSDGSLFLDAWLQSYRKTTLQSMASDLTFDLDIAGSDIGAVHRSILAMGILGLSVPMQLLRNLHSQDTISAALKMVSRSGEHLIRTTRTLYSGVEDLICDFGHIQLSIAVWNALKLDESMISSLYERIITAIFEISALQSLAPRFLRVAHASPLLSPAIKSRLMDSTAHLQESRPDLSSTRVLTDLLILINDDIKHENLLQILIDLLSGRVRSNAVDSFIALPVLLRNNLGALDDAEKLKALSAARPSLDRIGFKFLTKYLGDHIPGELGAQAVDDTRTAAARDPDDGHSVAAYLRLVSQRGSEEQTMRAETETRTWLEVNPEDRIVRRAFLDFVLKKGSNDLKLQTFEQTAQWLEMHLDEGPLRKGFLDLTIAINDTKIIDKALESTANWIEKRGNNRWVRKTYLDLVRQRGHRETTGRAAQAMLAWLKNNRDDRDALRALLAMAGRLEKARLTADVLSLAHGWLGSHLHDADIMRSYLTLIDRAGEGKSVSDAVEYLDAYIAQNPDAMELRETLLSLAAKNVDKKLQQRVYDRQSQWLEQLPQVNPTMEYMIGRLGVRAGIARRAIPLLERAGKRDDSDLREHALLWLGSAYRISGEYIDARAVWQKVMESTDERMKEKAQKNLESLNAFMAKTYPNGYPPPDERAPRAPRKPQREQPATGTRRPSTGGQESAAASAVTDDTQSLPNITNEISRSPRRTEQAAQSDRTRIRDDRKPRMDRPHRPEQQQHSDRPVRHSQSDQDRPARQSDSSAPRQQSPQPPRRDRGPGQGDGGRRRNESNLGTSQSSGATLGDLLKLKGLNLMAELEKAAKEKNNDQKK